jgi:hypothetical protein
MLDNQGGVSSLIHKGYDGRHRGPGPGVSGTIKTCASTTQKSTKLSLGTSCQVQNIIKLSHQRVLLTAKVCYVGGQGS